jgi:hypothetical protein
MGSNRKAKARRKRKFKERITKTIERLENEGKKRVGETIVLRKTFNKDEKYHIMGYKVDIFQYDNQRKYQATLSYFLAKDCIDYWLKERENIKYHKSEYQTEFRPTYKEAFHQIDSSRLGSFKESKMMLFEKKHSENYNHTFKYDKCQFI